MGSWPATAAGGVCLITTVYTALDFFTATSGRMFGLGPMHFAIMLGFAVLLLHVGRYPWMGVVAAIGGGIVLMAKPLVFPIRHERGPFTLTSETHLYYVVPALLAGFVALALALGPRPEPRETGPVPALPAVVILSGLAGIFPLMQFFAGRGALHSVVGLLVPGVALVAAAIVATRGRPAMTATAWPTPAGAWSPSAWSSVDVSAAPSALTYVDPSMDALLAAVAEAPTPLGLENLAGRRFGPYEVLGLLGRGGMGQVYRTRDHRLLRDVALKLLPAGRDDASRRARLLQEARAAAQLNHPHVAQIYDVSVDGPRPYLVMELCEGWTLRERLRQGPCEPAEVNQLARQIASALAAAHARGIVHRDLKPENVMVDAVGQLKVLDFGLARVDAGAVAEAAPGHLTREGAVVGTPAYMSPEQARGEHVDARTDVFAFGLVVHELLTGHLPARDEHGLAIAQALPPPWAALVASALSLSPEQRPADGQALLQALSG